VFDVLVDSD
jgi:hypothetical protein